MRESKKRNKIWQGLSLTVLVSILGLFFYLNVQGEDKGEQVESEKPKISEIQEMKVVKPIASLEWDEPEVPATISDNVYYGHPNQLDDEIILSDSGLEYKKIEVNESGDEFLGFDSIQNPRIKHISEFDANYHRYIQDGSESKYMRKGVRNALISMLDYLPQNFGIIYVEGYMSPKTYQKRLLFRFNRGLKQNSNPSQAYVEALAAVPKSSLTGGAISIAIYDIAKNQMVELDNTHEMGQRDETFSPKTTPEHRKNRLILLDAAIKAGFVNYGMMWWYFAMDEKMSAYVNDQDKCGYGTMSYDEATGKFAPYRGNLELDLKDLMAQNSAETPPALPAQKPVTPAPVKISKVTVINSIADLEKYSANESLVILKTVVDNCVWCDKVKASYEAIAEEKSEHTFLEVNLRKAPEIGKKFGIRTSPTFVILHKGLVVEVQPSSDFEAFKDKLSKSEEQLRLSRKLNGPLS